MSHHDLRVHSLPQQIEERELAGSAVVVIDVLRATTTICQALASGARDVVPFRTIDETLAASAVAGRGQVMLGGERGGRRIDGFDLGNSPSEYTPQAVGGRRVFITTTNGTQAMYHARKAARVVLGSLLNLSAVAASVKDEPRIDILCAGTDGQATDEDILAAGGMVHQLCDLPCGDRHLSDAAAMAGARWSPLLEKARAAGRTLCEQLAAALRESAGGRNLVEIGLDRDILDCAQVDRLHIVPELDVQQWRITVR